MANSIANKNKKYVIMEFGTCKKEDYDNLVINCKTFIARMYTDYSFEVDGNSYSNKEFHLKFSVFTF
ncbi:hypothetical protein U732_9 [Clostridium argentinense CDC 2741]|uniref:Uncharacterized protein n=2 Tax=Clostridium argentinense TaxID=29341 RepID=A0A0C1QTU2_9CLOT|nr:hypothetical protein [Clostridium argentinense]ARC83130.1 hypothetical protein RSJ17_00320 [Clostridium argentinense]KIE44402.1 hypothetical protein U732_9 [Clostridium argentinense CDC 2741]NFF41316.1 hypothetical protein [Clostridium argentinense]NFP51789.1 hypothetical protein [Clostridium argentinense]NFP74241.1 hypothetical protein [Clostridium argentinense]